MKFKSGEKEFKFIHKANRRYKELTGKDSGELINQLMQGKLNSNDVYDVIYAVFQDDYETIEDMLDDLSENMVYYIQEVSVGLGELFGAKTTITEQKQSEKSKPQNQA